MVIDVAVGVIVRVVVCVVDGEVLSIAVDVIIEVGDDVV